MHFKLLRHPDTPSPIRSVEVELSMSDSDEMVLTYRVTPGDALAVPQPASPGRADGLWQHSCFEVFIMPEGGEGYFEFNFSPSTQWAAYAFHGYRAGMRDLAMQVAPFIDPLPSTPDDAAVDYALEVDLDLSEMPSGVLRLGLAAVIEATDGTKSYWALAHPVGKADFHHADGFVLELPAV